MMTMKSVWIKLTDPHRRGKHRYLEGKRFSAAIDSLEELKDSERTAEYTQLIAILMAGDFLEAESIGALQWERRRKLVATVRTSIEKCRLPLTDADDLMLCYALFRSGDSEHDVPLDEMVEHYIGTGEFLEIMDLLTKGNKGFFWNVTRRNEVSTFQREGLCALYDYDMNVGKGAADEDSQGDDDDAEFQLPVEVRMAFSGFYDKVGT